MTPLEISKPEQRTRSDLRIWTPTTKDNPSGMRHSGSFWAGKQEVELFRSSPEVYATTLLEMNIETKKGGME